VGKVTILPETTVNPITLIGQRAGVCWGADTKDAEKNYRRGWDCIVSGHGRTLEFVNVEMVLDGLSAKFMREWYTHIGCLPTRLQASTRYINYNGFEFVTPHTVDANDRAKAIFNACMSTINASYAELMALGIPAEDASYILPFGMQSKMVDKRNLRNLIDMSRNRQCVRALWEFREGFDDICSGLKQYGLDHGSHEWETIIDTQFMPKCEMLGYCPEKNGCGKMAGKK
jgi:thymidylate synthase (FAD)